MRTLKLENDKGIIYDLLDDTFLHNPKGLGFRFSNEYNEHILLRKQTKRKLSFEQVQGTMIFKSYAAYSDFVTYIMGSKELKLLYCPDKVTYYNYISVEHLEKGEIDRSTGTLNCSVGFNLLGYWTKDAIILIGDKNVIPENPSYPFTYGFTYGSSNLYGGLVSINIENKGHAPAPIKIKITGYSDSPSWTLNDQSGQLLMEILQDQEVTIDSRENQMVILSGTTVLDAYKNHLLQNYIYAPVGKSVLVLEGVMLSEVTIYEQYASI